MGCNKPAKTKLKNKFFISCYCQKHFHIASQEQRNRGDKK